MSNKIRLEFDAAELRLLAMMAENELFRMRFIDPRFPGYRQDGEIFRVAQTVTARLSERVKIQKGVPSPEESWVQRRNPSKLHRNASALLAIGSNASCGSGLGCPL